MVNEISVGSILRQPSAEIAAQAFNKLGLVAEATTCMTADDSELHGTWSLSITPRDTDASFTKDEVEDIIAEAETICNGHAQKRAPS